MTSKFVVQLDANGYAVGITEADESPREPGVFLIPAGCVDSPMPALSAGEVALWTGSGFVVVTSPTDTPALPAGSDPMTLDQTIAFYSMAVQKRLDDFLATRRYDSTSSIAKYDDITDAEIDTLAPDEQTIVQRYRAETRYIKVKIAQTWARSELIMGDVVDGNRPMLTLDDLFAELPVLEWPV